MAVTQDPVLRELVTRRWDSELCSSPIDTFNALMSQITMEEEI
jgi:hypothetical protein